MKLIYNGTISNNGMQHFSLRKMVPFLGNGGKHRRCIRDWEIRFNFRLHSERRIFPYDSNVDHSTPVQIERSGVKSVVAGPFHTLFVKNDGSLWEWDTTAMVP